MQSLFWHLRVTTRDVTGLMMSETKKSKHNSRKYHMARLNENYVPLDDIWQDLQLVRFTAFSGNISLSQLYFVKTFEILPLFSEKLIKRWCLVTSVQPWFPPWLPAGLFWHKATELSNEIIISFQAWRLQTELTTAPSNGVTTQRWWKKWLPLVVSPKCLCHLSGWKHHVDHNKESSHTFLMGRHSNIV